MLIGGIIIKVWGQIVLLGTTTFEYTRIVATNTMESAATRFAELAGNPPGFSENTSDYNYSIEGIGKLSYQRGSENGQYLAQVTVDLKQVPSGSASSLQAF